MTDSSFSQLQRDASQYMIHPFVDNAALKKKGARIMSKAEGVYVWDDKGNKYLDAFAGLWCVNLGYGRKELIDAAAKQMAELPYYNLFFNGGENHSNCSNCDLKFEIEPGFFYGAMYVSYGLGIGIGSLILIISLAVFQMKNILLLSLIIGISILILAPVNYFLSRLIWLNAFIDNKS